MTLSPRDPLVAIVTSVCNGRDFLAETMECVQTETNRKFVHCVLGNASTDATLEIITPFAGRRVPMIKAPNAATIPVIENWNGAPTLAPPGTDHFGAPTADDKIVPGYVAKVVAMGEQHHHKTGTIACQERTNTFLIHADLPRDGAVFGSRTIVTDSYEVASTGAAT